ncbi:ER membrane protein DP1/Yop1 [Basidiobolus ranarum]|uniref:Protein YOP1 n=1 Tax=Basidiobolus ranarum TaxID=34480 RepID=A0ABR2W8R4_9FUNG
MDKVRHYQAQLEKELNKYPIFQQLEQKTGVPKTYAVGACGGLFVLFIFFNIAGSLLTNLVGWVYPAYASFKAIESHTKEDDTQWLTYWTVYGFVNVLEYFSDALLYWIPFYYLFKLGALLWLLLPQFKGAEYVYKSFLRPLLLQHESRLDGLFGKVTAKANDAINNINKTQ